LFISAIKKGIDFSVNKNYTFIIRPVPELIFSGWLIVPALAGRDA
jgi:hypothetical protein